MIAVDILIVGGGPAGLLAALHLAELSHSVALIERATLGETTKFWVTTERRLLKNGLGECVLSTPRRMTAGTFLGSNVSVRGDFAVADERRVLSVLSQRARTAGAQLFDNCTLLNLSWTGDLVTVQTTCGAFSTRLLADASGGGSPIAQTFRLHHVDGFYAVRGGMLQDIELKSQDIILGHVSQLGDPPPIFEVVPTGESSAYCVLFIFSKGLVPPASLAAAFEMHCHHNPFFSFTRSSRIVSEKSGAIPIGSLTKRKLPGVVLLGEAGMIQPPLMGTAFNEVLEHSHSVCSTISRSLMNSKSICRPPRRLYPTIKLIQDRLQLEVAKILINANVETIDRTLRSLGTMPEKLLFNFFSNELTWPQLLHVTAHLPWNAIRHMNAT